MKNWKKLISGVVAMMAVATAVSATPAKVPVEVLDVADATGIAVDNNTVANEKIVAAADNGGYWTLSNGSSTGIAGSIGEEENVIGIRRNTGKTTREVSAGYTTNSDYSYADTKVQFTYRCNTIDAFKGHLIQVSSDTLSTTMVSDEIVNAANGLNYVEKYYNDSAIFVVLDGQLKYVDATDGALKDAGFTIKEDTNYSFRLERTAGSETYDLYVDTLKIGVNSTPVLENIPLMNPTGKNFSQVRAWLGSSANAEDPEHVLNYTVYLSDISFMQSLTDDEGMVEVVDERFDARPEGDGWSYVEPTNKSGTKQGTVSANGALSIGYKSTVTTTREIVASYVNDEMASADKYEVSFEVIPNYTETYAEYFVLMNSGSAALEGDNVPADTPRGITAFTDSVQVAFAGNKIYYGSTEEGVNSYKELTAVTYENNIKYYAKIAVDTVNKTYDLYLSKEPITLATAPVLEDKGFFCPSANTVPDVLSFRLKKHTDVAGAGAMGVDNLLISKKAVTLTEVNNPVFMNESFDALPSTGWSYRTDYGSVTADGKLSITYSQNTGRTRNAYAQHISQEFAELDAYDMSFDFIPDYVSADYALTIDLMNDGASGDASVTPPTGVGVYGNSIQIAMAGDKFLYGATDADGNSYKEIPGVTYENGKKYYAKVSVNNVAKTYDLYLQDTEITAASKPVIKGASFFCPVDGISPNKLQFLVKRNTANNTLGSIVVDNLLVVNTSKDGIAPTDFAVMNDDQQYMTSLGTSKYIDLINVPADKKVIVAYYDAENKLVDVEVATGDSLRAIKADETAVSALVMTWEDFDNIVPVNAAIELK